MYWGRRADPLAKLFTLLKGPAFCDSSSLSLGLYILQCPYFITCRAAHHWHRSRFEVVGCIPLAAFHQCVTPAIFRFENAKIRSFSPGASWIISYMPAPGYMQLIEFARAGPLRPGV